MHEPIKRTPALTLAAEEASHYDLEATGPLYAGQPVTFAGDRVMVRNLVENARRYGGYALCLAAEGDGRRFRVKPPAA